MSEHLTTEIEQSFSDNTVLIISYRQQMTARPIRCSFDSIDKKIEIHSEKNIEIGIQFCNPPPFNAQYKNLELEFVFKTKPKDNLAAGQTLNSTECFTRPLPKLFIRRHPDLTSEDDKVFRIQYGRVSSQAKGLNYGTICTEDNQEVYFHRDSFDNDSSDQISESTRLKFVVVDGILGPQAVHIKEATLN